MHGNNEDLRREMEEFRTTLNSGLARINLRIDHLWGKHDTIRITGCPSCEAVS